MRLLHRVPRSHALGEGLLGLEDARHVLHHRVGALPSRERRAFHRVNVVLLGVRAGEVEVIDVRPLIRAELVQARRLPARTERTLASVSSCPRRVPVSGSTPRGWLGLWSSLLSGPLWSSLVLYGPLSLVLSGPLWSSLSGPLWSSLVLYGPLWSSLLLSGPLFSSLLPSSPLFSPLLLSSPLFSSLLLSSPSSVVLSGPPLPLRPPTRRLTGRATR